MRRDLQQSSNDDTDETGGSDIGGAQDSSGVLCLGSRSNGRHCRRAAGAGGGSRSDLGEAGASSHVAARCRVEGGGGGDGPLDGDGLVEDGGGSLGACCAISEGQQRQKSQREYRRDLHLDRNTGSLLLIDG